MERSLGSVSIGPLRPRTAFRLTPSGLEVKVSFPVQLHEATEADDRVTREILKQLDRESKLKMVGSDIPPFDRSPPYRLQKPVRGRPLSA